VSSEHRWARVRCIGLDGDDTLWHNEDSYQEGQRRWRELLTSYGDADELDRALLATERRNLGILGYGVKSFTLSMVETAIEVSGGAIAASDLGRMLEIGREMLCAPVRLLPGARETVERLARGPWRLLLITKGDMVHQERRVAGSGLGPLFEAVEIVSEKDEATYRDILERYGVEPESFLMVGNSIRSDAVSVLDIGGAAAHIPYPLIWEHELAEPPTARERFIELGTLTELADLLGA
jgi:putative hydrolase of the HAD superfamily